MLRAALDYPRVQNWSVFPCRARDKVPLTDHGLNDASRDLATIQAWWAQWPDANVAVPAGEVNGFFVLDVDEHDGVSGNATLARLEQEHGKLPPTVEQCTPSGGKHLLFRSNGTTIRNSAGKLGPGLDVRSDGGYIIVSPSIGQNGARYRWLRTPGPGQIPIADAPPWLLDLLAEPKPIASTAPPTLVATQSGRASPYAQAALEYERASVALAVKGSRNDTLNKAAFLLGQLVAAGQLARSRVEEALLDAATRCALVADDGVAAARRTIASGLDDGMKDPREIPEPSAPASVSAREPALDVLATDSRWPGPTAPEAFHGLAGEIVRAIEPHTEADPIALLIHQYLACFGNALGRGPYYQVESDRHFSNLFTVLVGETAKARKGTSAGRVREIFSIADEQWTRDRVHSGLSSGEGVIWAVRDPIKQWVKEGKGANAPRVEQETDPGVTDKRLMVFEPEFSGALRVMQREGNILSRVIRDAWDRGDLGTLTKNSPARATGALISIVGHITAHELRESLDRTEMANGFANRFIYLCVRRSKLLPHGGRLDEAVIQEFGDKTRQAIQRAGAIKRVTMTPEARTAWEVIYGALSEGQSGLLGAITARAEAQVVRLATLYALIDGKAEIAVEHLRAAVALWEYAEASARYIFGDVLGDPVADAIRRALGQAGPSGMTRTEISALFGRHRSTAQIDRALAYLAQQGKAKLHEERVAGQGGRPPERWVATQRGA